MKKQYVWIVGLVIIITIGFYLVDRLDGEYNHPTLNEDARMPDAYLKNVQFYEESDRHEMSAYNLEKAIASIKKIESDVDTKSSKILGDATNKLEQIRKSILLDSINKNDMKATFELSLNSLAHAELEISEMYAEINQIDKAKIALKYAQLHIKNAMLLHNPYWETDSTRLSIEKNVFLEMDSLISNVSYSPIKYSLELDKMIKEVDILLNR